MKIRATYTDTLTGETVQNEALEVVRFSGAQVAEALARQQAEANGVKVDEVERHVLAAWVPNCGYEAAFIVKCGESGSNAPYLISGVAYVGDGE